MISRNFPRARRGLGRLAGLLSVFWKEAFRGAQKRLAALFASCPPNPGGKLAAHIDPQGGGGKQRGITWGQKNRIASQE
jgi:hypothetical protein